jgi:competence protein ComEA
VNCAVLLAAGFALAVSQRLAAQSNESLLPAGPPKDRMVKLCVGCHEVDLVVARRHTRTEWEGVIEDMIARGTKGSAEELAAVVDYLNKYLGKVAVNAASARELEEGLKISERDAKAIVSWREQQGKLKSFDEVRKAPGLDPASIADKRGWMSFD